MRHNRTFNCVRNALKSAILTHSILHLLVLCNFLSLCFFLLFYLPLSSSYVFFYLLSSISLPLPSFLSSSVSFFFLFLLFLPLSSSSFVFYDLFSSSSLFF